MENLRNQDAKMGYLHSWDHYATCGINGSENINKLCERLEA